MRTNTARSLGDIRAIAGEALFTLVRSEPRVAMHEREPAGLLLRGRKS
jgi:hypothetical protein